MGTKTTSLLVGVLFATVFGGFAYSNMRYLAGSAFGPIGMESPQAQLDRMHRTVTVPTATVIAAVLGCFGSMYILERQWGRTSWLVLGGVTGATALGLAPPWRIGAYTDSSFVMPS